MAEPRSLSDCTAYYKQEIQVIIWPRDQSGSGILKGVIDSLPNPDERSN